MSEVNDLIGKLLEEDSNIYAVAIVDQSGNLITQTENWDISNDLDQINELLGTKLELGQKGMTSIQIQGVKYMIVENTEERKIATNVQGQGHIIICPIPVGGNGGLITYINPAVGPRDALFTVQNYAQQFSGHI
jgi:predicted regulator of Ras-like GTPase activity (Roadblock/LC7/MglB family)